MLGWPRLCVDSEWFRGVLNVLCLCHGYVAIYLVPYAPILFITSLYWAVWRAQPQSGGVAYVLIALALRLLTGQSTVCEETAFLESNANDHNTTELGVNRRRDLPPRAGRTAPRPREWSSL